MEKPETLIVKQSPPKPAKFDKQQIEKIVALHEENRNKDEAVKELKSEMQTFQSTTAE